jgi:hypothetical protein
LGIPRVQILKNAALRVRNLCLDLLRHVFWWFLMCLVYQSIFFQICTVEQMGRFISLNQGRTVELEHVGAEVRR